MRGWGSSVVINLYRKKYTVQENKILAILGLISQSQGSKLCFKAILSPVLQPKLVLCSQFILDHSTTWGLHSKHRFYIGLQHLGMGWYWLGKYSTGPTATCLGSLVRQLWKSAGVLWELNIWYEKQKQL